MIGRVEQLEETPGRALVESGAPVAGTMAHTAAGLLFDPGSARVRLDDGLLAWLRRIAIDADVDAPSPGSARARCRAGATLAFATELSVTRAAQGRTVRTDGFLTPGPGDRAPADEIGEAVVLTARGEAEEWRVRHLGYLLAEAAVAADLDAAVVSRGLRLATSLTGRQLVLLAAVGRRERIPLPMTPVPRDPRGWAAWAALEDLGELQRGGLLDPPPPAPRPGGSALPRLRPADLRLTRRGVLVHRLLALEFVRDEAVAAALADLAG